MKRLLFLCVANAARSQMAEALARHVLGPSARVQSAGSAPGRVHPLAVRALEEIGVSTEGLTSKHVDTIDPSTVDLVITLCAEEECPVFLGDAERWSWAMPDPDRKGEPLTDEQRMDAFRAARDAILGRLRVFAALDGLPTGPEPTEFHASVRVRDLAASARFYAWLFGEPPRTWTHRYVTFVPAALRANFVILVDDGLTLHHDTLYHLGVAVADQAAVIEAQHRAEAAGWPVHKPARTTWRGTPLHELWLTDPDGNLIEIYARLTDEELAMKPADLEPRLLVGAP